jgi:3-carboxy-cis,cis-muconate cycloisomerase
MSESLAMALAAHVGRPQAQRIVQDVGRRALAEGLTLSRAAHADARVGAALSPEDIDRALDPAGYLGSTDIFIDRALETYRALQD